MNKFIFDVDGTLTPSRQNMNGDFQHYFLEFCYDNPVYLITGSDRPKTVEQVGEDICEAVKRIYNCNGNDVWEGNVNVYTNDWSIPEEPRLWLARRLADSDFPLRTGNHFEERPGMLNFSIVGRNATKEERTKYIKWDTVRNERKTISDLFNQNFPELQATVGGETGIDISLKGLDKGQIIKDFDEDDTLYFFGDKMDPEGNDYPLSVLVDKTYHVKNWRQTYEYLQWLQEMRLAQ